MLWLIIMTTQEVLAEKKLILLMSVSLVLVTVDSFEKIPFTLKAGHMIVIKTFSSDVGFLLSSSGKVYAVGGHDGNEHLGNMEMFDPFTNKWMMKASMNTKRYSNTHIKTRLILLRMRCFY